MMTLAKKIVKRLLARKGLAIIPIEGTVDTCARRYISAKETVSAAEREGLSVCDYVEKLWGKQGDTQRVIDQMASCGAFAATNPNVVEIGTGTGRYLEKLLQRCTPAKYESYETARDWARWLQSKYSIVSHEADGVTLKQTPDKSVDLVHAHGVFVYLPFFVCYRYWKEIWRVTRNGSVVAFDIISEDCLDERTVDKWLSSQHNYPCFLSTNFVVRLFAKHGFSLLKTFSNRYGEGHSEYLVFIRDNMAQLGTALDGNSGVQYPRESD